MRGVDFLMLALATQRLSGLWFEEIARPLRDRLIRRAGRVGFLAGCNLCVSVWAGAAITALWLAPWGRYVIWPLALSAAALSGETLMRALMTRSR